LWTPTAVIGGSPTLFTWGGYDIDEPTNSCIDIADRPACNYCDSLIYAGYSDWVLPSCVSGAKNSNCILWQFGADACGAYPCTPSWDSNANSALYWSSTEYDVSHAWVVDFTGGNTYWPYKVGIFYVRCVRGQ